MNQKTGEKNMQRLKIYFLVASLVLIAVGLPFSIASAEGFKIEATGMQYNDDYNSVKVTAKNNVDLWIRFVEAGYMDLSMTQLFIAGTFTTIPITMYLVTDKKLSFIGSAFIDDESFFSIQGIITAKGINGTYMQHGIVTAGVFSAGKFKSVK
jgi:hypothetical protein